MIIRIGLDITTPQKEILDWLIPRGPSILNSPGALNLTPPTLTLEKPRKTLYWYLEPDAVYPTVSPNQDPIHTIFQTIRRFPGVVSVEHVLEMEHLTREYILEDLFSIDALVLQWESRRLATN